MKNRAVLWAAMVLAGVISLPVVFGGDPGLTGLAVKDREQYYHRLKHVRMKRPDDPKNSFRLANLYYSLQMEDEAIKEYRRTLRLDPKHADAKWFLSHVLVSKGYYEEAFRLAREVLDHRQDDPDAFLWAGEILVKMELTDVAKQYFARADQLMFPPKGS